MARKKSKKSPVDSDVLTALVEKASKLQNELYGAFQGKNIDFKKARQELSELEANCQAEMSKLLQVVSVVKPIGHNNHKIEVKPFESKRRT